MRDICLAPNINPTTLTIIQHVIENNCCTRWFRRVLRTANLIVVDKGESGFTKVLLESVNQGIVTYAPYHVLVIK
jgi:hypothetical protein